MSAPQPYLPSISSSGFRPAPALEKGPAGFRQLRRSGPVLEPRAGDPQLQAAARFQTAAG
jgi:hypothetical protein